MWTLYLTLFVWYIFIFTSCTGDFFYIYDWPKELADVYPPPNAPLHAESVYHHDFYPNHGSGQILDGKIGLFQTWQFSLFKNIFQRLQVSSKRTFDPTNATAFIIPFDAGVHSYIDHMDGKKRLGSPFGWMAKQLLEDSYYNTSKRPIFWKHEGHDHVVIFSITLYQMIGIGVKMFFQTICTNCSILVIESAPAFVSSLYPWPMKEFYQAIPYPSSYHWWEGIQKYPWQIQQTREKPGRNLWVLFIGSLQTATASANSFRRLLAQQCRMSNENHKIVNTSRSYNSHHSNNNNNHMISCEWISVPHSCRALTNNSHIIRTTSSTTSLSYSSSSNSNDLINNQSSSSSSQHIMKLFQQAVFCPAPVGDSLTRKSLFDSLVAGCIPVLFHPFSLALYTWHLSPKDIDQIAIIIQKEEIIEKRKNFVDILKEIPLAIIQAKQQAIETIAPRLQYAVVPESIRIDYENIIQQSAVTGKTIQSRDIPRWDPPFIDAVEIIIDHLVHPIPSYAIQQYQYSTSTSRGSAKLYEAIRNKCLGSGDLIEDGVVFSRGLAWHKLKQLCATVNILIRLQDGRIVDLQQQQQNVSSRQRSSYKKKVNNNN
jgi:hypothetical protein